MRVVIVKNLPNDSGSKFAFVDLDAFTVEAAAKAIGFDLGSKTKMDIIGEAYKHEGVIQLSIAQEERFTWISYTFVRAPK